MDRLGWSEHAHTDHLADDIALTVVDAPLADDVTFALDGPTTFSLSVFLQGRGTLSARGVPPVDVAPGTAILFRCRDRASGVNTLHGGRQFQFIDVRFEGGFLRRMDDTDLGLWNAHPLDATDLLLAGFPASSHLLRLAAEIMVASRTDTIARRLILHGKVIEALGAAIETLSRRREPGGILRPSDRSKVEQARARLEQRYEENWTIGRLAREVGLGEKPLKFGFRELVGLPIHAYLTKIRLDTAARHLDGGMNVTDAALAVGFGNLSHFSKVFREAKGVRPSLYARRR
ncbi:hypothetical protein VQ03_18055 [Methylobacterium tarhaniae]|uniref:HTH araC/xylS-type domain-containing protein n=1 Tax=Methylobacterium tarhaniae TaxID=1187852 RepID=A0A0J6SWL1_9HYPH|nr:hypothetical protein VQ03_18055 [Methylobacterium tarhaniae]